MNVFDFAMDIEQSGRHFYRELAKKAATPGVRKIFAMLAADEERLLGRLQAMRRIAQASNMEDSRALEYCTNIFRDVLIEREALAVRDDLEAYRFGMRVENEICKLYERAAEREKNPDAGNLLRRIAAEERRELESLREVFDFANAPNEFLAWGEFSNLDEFHNFGRDEG